MELVAVRARTWTAWLLGAASLALAVACAPDVKDNTKGVPPCSGCTDLTLAQVQQLIVTPLTPTSVQLDWTLPTDPAFTSVVIRRSSTGYVTSASDGTLVCETSADPLITTCPDTGLDVASDTYYSALAYYASRTNYSWPKFGFRRMPWTALMQGHSGLHSLAVRGGQVTWGWGFNGSGQAGDNTTTSWSGPVRVCAAAACTSYQTGMTALSVGGDHSLGIAADGSAWAWGSNSGYGMLGDGTLLNRKAPVQVCAPHTISGCSTFLGGIVSIAAGYQHSLAADSNGHVWAWGQNNSFQLGDGTASAHTVPKQVCGLGTTCTGNDFLSGIVAVSGGDAHSLALDSTGNVYAWGDKTFGQLGNGEFTPGFSEATPVQVCAAGQVKPCNSFITNIKAIAAGGNFSVALDTTGTVWTWGRNDAGQLGDGTTTNQFAPVEVCAPGQNAPCGAFLTGITAIAAGFSYVLALDNAGFVWAWGNNTYGQLGNGTLSDSKVPVQVCAPGTSLGCTTYLSNVAQIGGGRYHSLAIRGDGTLWGWGDNENGEVGDNSGITRNIPVQVP